MLVRNADKLAAAQQEVMRATGVSADVIPTRICDLASLLSVRDFCKSHKLAIAWTCLHADKHLGLLMNMF